MTIACVFCLLLRFLEPGLQNTIGTVAIIVLLSVVWGTLLFVAFTVWRIAHAGK